MIFQLGFLVDMGYNISQIKTNRCKVKQNYILKQGIEQDGYKKRYAKESKFNRFRKGISVTDTQK